MSKKPIIALFLLLSLLICPASLTGCATQAQAADLMADMQANPVAEKPADNAFTASQLTFALNLFGQAITEGDNPLVSPLSVALALAMTANGAQGDTLSQLAQAISPGVPLEELNEYFHTYLQQLPSTNSSGVQVANALWLRETSELRASPEFLQKNADYYGAAIYKAPFDQQTVTDMNRWVSEATQGMIPSVVDTIDPSAVMFLLNALAFQGVWESPYAETDMGEGSFTSLSDRASTVTMMFSQEGKYLSDNLATGFIKDYAGGTYSFAVLLPNAGVGLDEYVEDLCRREPAALLAWLQSPQCTAVNTALPQFSLDCSLNLNKALKALGVTNAFDEALADFTGMDSSGGLYMSQVLHKTHITVAGLGTKAGAMTAVQMSKESAILDSKEVICNRPFVYLILDNATGLPLFIGALTELEGSAIHSHQPAASAQTVDDPITGFCGNTQATIYHEGTGYSFTSDDAVTLTGILCNLSYDPAQLCSCPAEFTADTEFGVHYEVNLTQAFVRCSQGQASLTAQQQEQLQDIWTRVTQQPPA